MKKACGRHPGASAPIPAQDDMERLRNLEEKAAALSREFESLESDDVAAFEGYLHACRMPRSTPEEKRARDTARAAAATRATSVPMATLEAARDALLTAEALLELSRRTPLGAESDLFAAVELASSCFRAAELNVAVNLPQLPSEEATAARERWIRLRTEIDDLCARLRAAAPVPEGVQAPWTKRK